MLQILDEAGGCLVYVFAAFRKLNRKIPVMIPITMIKLNESHPAFGKPPREKTICSKCTRPFGVLSVELKRVGRLFR